MERGDNSYMEDIIKDLRQEAETIYVQDDFGDELEVEVVSAWRVAKMAGRAPQTVYDQCDRGTLECYFGEDEVTGYKLRKVPIDIAAKYIYSRKPSAGRRTYTTHPTKGKPLSDPERILQEYVAEQEAATQEDDSNLELFRPAPTDEDPLAEYRNRRPLGPA